MTEAIIMSEVITEIREALGLNKTELAEALGCSPALVTLLEQGKRTLNPALTRRLWDITEGSGLRQLLADAALECAGIPTVDDGARVYVAKAIGQEEA